jgi:hypothetical protein
VATKWTMRRSFSALPGFHVPNPSLASTSASLIFAPLPVPAANQKIAGFAAPNILSPELIENPSALTNFYGYTKDGPLLPAPAIFPRQ